MANGKDAMRPEPMPDVPPSPTGPDYLAASRGVPGDLFHLDASGRVLISRQNAATQSDEPPTSESVTRSTSPLQSMSEQQNTIALHPMTVANALGLTLGPTVFTLENDSQAIQGSPPKAPIPWGATAYEFPTDKLAPIRNDTEMEPLVLVACGSFSPITYLHLRMFEMARDRIAESRRFYLLGGYFSPVSDAYGKTGLVASQHRVAMCELAVRGEYMSSASTIRRNSSQSINAWRDGTPSSNWLMVDSWEARQSHYQRTVVVLDHFGKMLNGPDGYAAQQGSKRRVRIMLLAGGDLIESFGVPGLWSPDDLERILGEYGCLIVERTGVDVKGFLLSHDILYKHRAHILIAKQYIHNDISSSKIRLFIKRNMSIKYLLPDPVIAYIEENKLFRVGPILEGN